MKLYDIDDFLIKKLKIEGLERIVSNQETIGVSSDNKIKFDIEDYKRISKWELEVNSDDIVFRLFSNLSADGYKMPKNIDDFRKDIADRNKSRVLYSTLVKDGYQMPDDFEIFYKLFNREKSIDYHR